MVICLERGADLHTAQLMPLPLTASRFSKIQIGSTFLVEAHPGSPGQRAVKRVYVPGWAGTRKVKPVWILLKQETVNCSGISWAICKSAPHSRQITMPATHNSVFYNPDALPANQPTASKHWRHMLLDILLRTISKWQESKLLRATAEHTNSFLYTE